MELASQRVENKMDLRDLKAKNAAVDKAGFKKRVERLLRTQRAQRVAANCAKGLRKVCKEVADSGGGPSRS